jgi:hypothetical protein
MGKRIKLGVVKLGERGWSSGAIITGANLRRLPEKPKAPEPKAAKKDEGEEPDED